MRIRRPRGKNLQLTNSGELALFTVGCGSAFSKKLYQNNILIVKGTDHVMIDCGTRTPQALAEYGRSVTDIHNWLITHSHADHVGGLEEVMLMGRYLVRKKPTIIITEEYQEILWNYSLRGNQYNEVHDGSYLTFDDYWNPVRPSICADLPRDTREITIGSINIKLVRTRHFPQQAPDWQQSAYSVGLIIDDRILFTGDTQYDPELVVGYDEIFHFELIFHDVQFFVGGIHAGLDEIVNLPTHIRNRTILVHYPDTWRDQVKRVRDEGFLGFAQQGKFYVLG